MNEGVKKDSKLKYFRSRTDIHKRDSVANDQLYRKFEAIIAQADRFRMTLLSKPNGAVGAT